MPAKLPDDRFPVSTRTNGGRSSRVLVAKCGAVGCGYSSDLTNNHSNLLPPEVVKRKFVQRGWLIGRRREDDRCPRCANANTKGAPVLRAIEILEEVLMPDPSPKPVAAPPRLPTLTENQKVMDALDEHYNRDAGMYRASWSDDSLAAKLDVPRVWVANVRAMFFGEGSNEAAISKRVDLVAARDKLTALSGDLEKSIEGQMALLDRVQTVMAEVDAALAA